jgi:Holliday junction resolvase RusA-like endonuclease
MAKIEIKPLSVNEAWKGRRFKSDKYSRYERDLMYLLPKMEISKTSKLEITLIFGVSNKASDIDNPVKPFLDILQKKYGFNDSQIYDLHVIKQITKKGKEYIEYIII